MIIADLPGNEGQRLEELNRLKALDTFNEPHFRDIAILASDICKTPFSFISVIDRTTQWFKAKVGFNMDTNTRNQSFCAHLLVTDGPLEVEDTTLDPRFSNNPLVVGPPFVKFYSGFPLISNGFKIGSICLLDTVAHSLNEEQRFAMKVLSGQIINLFELHVKNLEIQKRMEDLEQQQTELKNLTRSQSQIISYIAHDVRSPIASLKSIIELNELKVLSPADIDKLMTVLNKQLDGTLEMLTNLIEWGQAQIKRSKPHTRAVDLYHVVERKFRNFEISAQLKNNRLVNEVPVGFNVWADEYMLRFILRNLVGNANKFTSDGTITIAANVLDNQAEISVTDTGIGMCDEVVRKLFNPDYRISNPGTNNEKGTGIGLILAREFLEKLGSTLQVKSKVGKGTRFSFLLFLP